jgi:adenine/guanine phosphoribosyltransferase-like PRPP-binding protein
MRAIMLAVAAAFIMSVPMAAAVKAEDTTVIKKDVDGDRTKTVIKKKEEPREEKKVIIHKDND